MKRLWYNRSIMKSRESFGAAGAGETQHFDDFEAMDVALRGLKRVTEEKQRREAEAAEFAEVEVDNEEDGWRGEDTQESYWDDDEYDDYYQGEERLEELEREKRFEVMTIPQEILEEYGLPTDLPAGVAVMGGTARSLARRVVTGDKEPVRDLDLIYVPELAEPDNPASSEQLDAVSAKYMADDYKYGHGVETKRLEEYFDTRDFTINQCLVVGDKLLMTRAAYDDMQENIIRTTHDRQPREYAYVNNRTYVRALMLEAVLQECTSSYPTIESVMNGRCDEDGNLFPVSGFDVALVLNKTMARGVRTAMRMTEVLADYDVINDRFIDRPLALARALREDNVRFMFRPVDDNIEEGGMDEDFEVKTTSPIKERVRKNLREYKSRDSSQWTEPLSGQYTMMDYEIANGVA